MRCIRWSLLVVFALASGLAAYRQVAAESPAVKVGDQIGKLTFKDIRYLTRSLDDFHNKKAFVLAFTTTSCPLAQRYLPSLAELDKSYRDKGVQFLSVNVGADDSIVATAAQAVRHSVDFPFVKDFDGSCVRAVGVTHTPAVVVLDSKYRLCYRGRIDDQYRLGGTRESPSRRDLQEAIKDVLAGREVAIKETPVEGCPITRPEVRPSSTPVTFAEHIAPLVQKHCQECHRPGTSAPFSLISYQQVAAKANAIAEVVTDGRMPPWYACDEIGHFINRRGLSAAERDMMIAWAHSGKPMGDEAKLPKLKVDLEKADRWLIGKPDLILPASRESLPASGDIPYKYVVLPDMMSPSPFKADTWMQGIQILPDNPRSVHHCNMAYIIPGQKYSQDNFITGTVPGGSPMLLDNGVGFRIPKGAKLVLQIHYVSTGKPEKCRISVGFKFASGIINKQLQHTLLVDNDFAIPPGAPAHPVANSKTFNQDEVGVGLFVHMHLRGRDMTFIAHYPDGTTENLLLVPNYSFDWQIPYVWAPGAKRFPKGTRLEAVAHYDNSSFNVYNPNPNATVKEGQQTRDEMMNGFVFYTHADEKLNLDIDPKTGHVRSTKQAKGS
jgi:peroxiredoxin